MNHPKRRLVVGFLLCAAATLAQGPTRWTGTSGGFRVTITDKDVVATNSKGAKTFSLPLADHMGPDPGDDDSTSQDLSPLSLVGPYLSLERELVTSSPGAAHPSSLRDFVTLDVRDVGPVSLKRWFTEEQLMAVLSQDRFVMEKLKLPRPGVTSLKDLADGFSLMNDCHFSFGENVLESFAFYDLDRQGRVAIRIGLTHTCISGDPADRSQLGVLLPIPPSLESDLKAAAKREHGFLMKDSRKIFRR
jgi:hypothetical protein